jgi:hypothetical protein
MRGSYRTFTGGVGSCLRYKDKPGISVKGCSLRSVQRAMLSANVLIAVSIPLHSLLSLPHTLPFFPCYLARADLA